MTTAAAAASASGSAVATTVMTMTIAKLLETMVQPSFETLVTLVVLSNWEENNLKSAWTVALYIGLVCYPTRRASKWARQVPASGWLWPERTTGHDHDAWLGMF